MQVGASHRTLQMRQSAGPPRKPQGHSTGLRASHGGEPAEHSGWLYSQDGGPGRQENRNDQAQTAAADVPACSPGGREAIDRTNGRPKPSLSRRLPTKSLGESNIDSTLAIGVALLHTRPMSRRGGHHAGDR